MLSQRRRVKIRYKYPLQVPNQKNNKDMKILNTINLINHFPFQLLTHHPIIMPKVKKHRINHYNSNLE
jgi:hypothetical protein